ncbi:hypothetical protein KP509_34G016300 [Ceratopteris richardii]|uniref:VQ domain-containing protein n=1 Tax=Ceratopteris richardii TaxID=49495 RepID=A0A8T2QHI5_CERRI|nr:hypothetical protein KP509_34G016300 [Ceratopteris richardii]
MERGGKEGLFSGNLWESQSRSAVSDARPYSEINSSLSFPGSSVKPLSSKVSMGILENRVNKKRSRASTRPPTAFLATDVSNFREMVQKLTVQNLTGVPRSSSSDSAHRTSLHRGGEQFTGFAEAWPTLDTSACFFRSMTNPLQASSFVGSNQGPFAPPPNVVAPFAKSSMYGEHKPMIVPSFLPRSAIPIFSLFPSDAQVNLVHQKLTSEHDMSALDKRLPSDFQHSAMDSFPSFDEFSEHSADVDYGRLA